jgi:cobalt-zinc-cadmium efflux system outer membrane protein
MHAFVRRALCALALFALPSDPAHADDPPPLSAIGGATLDRAALVRAVLARNPSAAVAAASLRVAEARADGAGAFADPSLRYQLAPQSLWDGSRSGHRLELAQPIAAWGKRGLVRHAARADADAARFDLAALRLDLALAASLLFDDLYLAARSLAINATHRELVEALRDASLARYEAGGAPKQAPLAAELEAARLEHREVELRAMQRIAAAQLNALLQRAPGAPLPPPPPSLPVPDAKALLGAPAPATRPELGGAAARAEARGAEAKLARRKRLPDVMLMAGYDGMWDMPEMRPMVGVEISLPIQRARRRSAIAEAEAMRDQAQRERVRVENEATLAVAVARERLAEAHHALGVVREQMLPAAQDQAEAATAMVAAGRGEFGDAIEAERSWYEAELAAEEALVATSRRAAELMRALGKSGVEDAR